MQSLWLRLAAIGLVGLLTPIWWSLAVSKLTYLIYVWSGSPERATTVLLWTTIYLPSLMLGVITGILVALVVSKGPLKGWLVFFGALLIGSLAMGVHVGGPSEYFRSMFGSVGNWFFFAGSILIPAIFGAKRRAV